MTDQTTETKSNTLADLAKIRKLAEGQAKAVKEFQEYLEQTPAYKALVEAKTALAEYNAKVEKIATGIKTEKATVIAEAIRGTTKIQRDAMFAEFKKLLPEGLSLRVNHSLEYNEHEAIKWCETNATAALKTVLEKKAFESLAETKDIEFVKKIDTPTITIASDLSMYL